jgi:hypothetical protein
MTSPLSNTPHSRSPSPSQWGTGDHSTPPVDITALTAAIQNEDAQELKNQLDTIEPDPETVKALLTQEGVLLSDQIVHVLLNYAKQNLQTQGSHLKVLLQHAVDTLDPQLTRQVLYEGANPHDIDIGYTSDEIADIIVQARENADLRKPASFKRTGSDADLQASRTEDPKSRKRADSDDSYTTPRSLNNMLRTGNLDLSLDDRRMLGEMFRVNAVPQDAVPPETPQAHVLNNQSASDTFPSYPDSGSDSDLSPEGDLRLDSRLEQRLNRFLDQLPNNVAAADTEPVPAANPEDRLQQLGYTTRQIKGIKSQNRREVIKWHQALVYQGCTLDQIVKISQKIKSLKYLAEKDIKKTLASLPNLKVEHVVEVLISRFGQSALDKLLEVIKDLHKDHPSSDETSLRFSTEQLVKIAKWGARPALDMLHLLRFKLKGDPYYLTSEEAVVILRHDRGSQALGALHDLMPELIQPLCNLSRAQVLKIAMRDRDCRLALEGVRDLLPILIKEPYNRSRDQVVEEAARQRGGRPGLENMINSEEGS